MPTPKFKLGCIVATSGASEALKRSGESALIFLHRHATGDWGEVGEEDWQLNNEALKDGSRLLSAYQTRLGDRLWIITEAEDDEGRRACTTILTPTEY